MMPIKLVQFILPYCLSKPSDKPATKTCNLFAALLYHIHQCVLCFSNNAHQILLRTSSPLPPHPTKCTMIKEKSDQLGSTQKSSVFVVSLSVTKVVTSVDIHNASHGPVIVKPYWSADFNAFFIKFT